MGVNQYKISPEKLRAELNGMENTSFTLDDDRFIKIVDGGTGPVLTLTAVCSEEDFPEDFYDIKENIESEVRSKEYAEENFGSGDMFWFRVMSKSDSKYSFTLHRVGY